MINNIKSSLLVTFDFSQRGKSGTGLAAGSLLSACRSNPEYGTGFTVKHLAVRMQAGNPVLLTPEKVVRQIQEKSDLQSLDSLALACYVWSSALIESVIARCRAEGFRGNVVLGGYQITAATCQSLYPSGDVYIPGYAEAALPAAFLKSPLVSKLVLDLPVDFDTLPSPYLDGTIELVHGQAMVHWETRRGCKFKCNFCAHRDLLGNRVNLLGMDKVRLELDLFKHKQVKKINVLDPVFNLEPNHLEILRYAKAIGLEALLSFQVRFECVTEEFLRLCAGLNVHLEFGLQTAVREEFKTINRPNHLKKVSKVIQQLHAWNQSFEVSLIYGLPGQTPNSFLESIEFLKSRGVETIKAFPLMLLEGTDLARDKERFGVVEDIIDDSGIPHVVASESFTRSEWEEMRRQAIALGE
ncbi:B12-binding domain-containing radical SAM protein [Photobacterium nomapromontoriensis]|uniref:B12-binding domain-containing radical SAM protein n=1 Tax=Photobacterium nomapromontoriensis TaxID=2910237 RepID=UPI003D113A8E